jgi:hypothetical protein
MNMGPPKLTAREKTSSVITMLAIVRAGDLAAIPILCDALDDAGFERTGEVRRLYNSFDALVKTGLAERYLAKEVENLLRRMNYILQVWRFPAEFLPRIVHGEPYQRWLKSCADFREWTNRIAAKLVQPVPTRRGGGTSRKGVPR